MIREIVKPENTNLTINIPEDYIGKQVEYIVFPIDNDINYEKDEHHSISSLKGILNQYADPSKIKLENQAWKLHIQEKYKTNG
jgi:hypothetical protein